MSGLLRLYPRRWRERYGEEFEELLAQRPPSVRHRLDIAARRARRPPPSGARRSRSGGRPLVAGAARRARLLLHRGAHRGRLARAIRRIRLVPRSPAGARAAPRCRRPADRRHRPVVAVAPTRAGCAARDRVRWRVGRRALGNCPVDRDPRCDVLWCHRRGRGRGLACRRHPWPARSRACRRAQRPDGALHRHDGAAVVRHAPGRRRRVRPLRVGAAGLAARGPLPPARPSRRGAPGRKRRCRQPDGEFPMR